MVLCYIVGVLCILAAVYYITYNTTQALWEKPNIYELLGPIENWGHIWLEKHNIILYPYQQSGWVLLLIGFGLFIFIPSLTAQIISESR